MTKELEYVSFRVNDYQKYAIWTYIPGELRPRSPGKMMSNALFSFINNVSFAVLISSLKTRNIGF